MSLYAIGDIQGCYAEFCELLELIAFDERDDRIWLVGDLVNRGPDSLAVLRAVKALGDAAITVLGNHDLHLLTIARGHRTPQRGDTLQAILDAPDRDALIGWLQTRPLVVLQDSDLLVHAGLLPGWTSATALELAHEVEATLADISRADDFLANLYGNEPKAWSDDLEGHDRLRVIVNACTRLRFCSADGTMDFREKRGPGHAPPGMRPWYAHAHRAASNVHVVCGHWSTLGLLLEPNVSALDTGCLWGGALTALRLSDRRVFQVPSRSGLRPMPAE